MSRGDITLELALLAGLVVGLLGILQLFLEVGDLVLAVLNVGLNVLECVR